MHIIDRRHTWLHAHFLTDCEHLPPHLMQEIESQIIPVLRNLGIVYDIHFDTHHEDPGVRIVLECLPLPNTTGLIQLELKRIAQPIPVKPREMPIVTFDRLATGGETAVPLPRSSTVAPEAGCEA